MSTLLAGLKQMTRPRMSREKSSKYVISSRGCSTTSSRTSINWSHLRREALKKKSNQSTIINLYAGNLDTEADSRPESIAFKRDSELCMNTPQPSGPLSKRSRLDSSYVQENSCDTGSGKEAPKKSLPNSLKLSEDSRIGNSTIVRPEYVSKCEQQNPELVEHDATLPPVCPMNEEVAECSASDSRHCDNFKLLAARKIDLPSAVEPLASYPPNICSELTVENNLANHEKKLSGKRNMQTNCSDIKFPDSKSSAIGISRWVDVPLFEWCFNRVMLFLFYLPGNISTFKSQGRRSIAI